MTTAHLKIVPLPETHSLKSLAYDALRSAIGELKIYDTSSEIRLDERDLSRRFGVSRTPLRAALCQLEREGLVRVVPRRGIYIIRKTRTEVREVVAVWCALQKMAARLLCDRGRKGQLEDLERVVESLDRTRLLGDADQYSAAEVEFDVCLLRASRIGLIGTLAGKLALHARSIQTRINSERGIDDAGAGHHGELLAALRRRDANGADALICARQQKLCADVDRYFPLH